MWVRRTPFVRPYNILNKICQCHFELAVAVPRNGVLCGGIFPHSARVGPERSPACSYMYSTRGSPSAPDQPVFHAGEEFYTLPMVVLLLRYARRPKTDLRVTLQEEPGICGLFLKIVQTIERAYGTQMRPTTRGL